MYPETQGRRMYGQNWKLMPNPRCLVVVKSVMITLFMELMHVIPSTRINVPDAMAAKLVALADVTRPAVMRTKATGYISPRP